MSVSQSLPSFAQAFSSSSLSEIAHISNALPPIQHRQTHSPPRQDSKKRQRSDRLSLDAPDPARQSPTLVRIKEEDRDAPPVSPPQPTAPLCDDDATPTVLPLSKKRRVTVSALPNTSPLEQPVPIPISPPPQDDPPPRTVVLKHQQKQFSDQRRDTLSTAISATGPGPIVPGSLLSTSPPSDQLTTSKLSRIGRVSPTTIPIPVVNRPPPNALPSTTTPSAQPITPPPLMVSQQPSALTSTEPTPKQHIAAAHSLPPPPISFARRRAAQPGGRKRKPADILISPRGAGPSDPLAPVIQSAPPVADPGRFPMAIPRLPIVLNNAQTTRRVASNVPPTPTRFSLQGGTSAPSISSTARSMHSPPNLSVPIANVLVPPTPHALQHPGYTGDKSAFLAPFEVFYDALNDSKQLKSWLSDQLQKSNTLMITLKQQQEKMDEIVEDLVEKRTRVMREEITMLRQRMESLEEALLAVRAESSTRPRGDDGYGYLQGGKFHQNGIPPGPESATPHRFPGPEQRRPDTIIKVTSPEGEREHPPSTSPPIEITRRPSISATSSRPEGLHGTYSLSGHSRSASGSQTPAKGTPPVRPQAIPERSSTTRPVESRTVSRLWSYGNGNLPVVEGQTTSSRGGDKS